MTSDCLSAVLTRYLNVCFLLIRACLWVFFMILMLNMCILDVASQEVLYLYIKDPLETKIGLIDPT